MTDKPRFTEEELQSAAAEVRVTMLRDMPKPAECEREFSGEFLGRMDEIMEHDRLKRRRELIIRTAISAAVVAALLIVAAVLGR